MNHKSHDSAFDAALGAAWWVPKAGIMALIIAGARRVSLRAVSVAAAIYAGIVINNIAQSLS